MDLSKQLKSNAMISLAQIFCQQPRNSVRHVFQACGKRCALTYPTFVRFVNCQPNSLSVPYCQQKPRNAELNGLFQCQFDGVDPKKFADGSALGAPGTIPLGQNGPLNPPGSCPANPSGPVPAGQQLTDIVNSPGAPGGSGAANGTTQNPPSSASDSAAQVTPSSAASASNTSPTPTATQATPSSAASASNTSSTPTATQAIPSSAASTANSSLTPTPTAATNSSASGSGSGFKAQNGKDAQALNLKFKSLTADSACTGKL
jgi:hypothetical protein